MSDRAVVVMAALTGLGAWAAYPVSFWVPAVLLLVALSLRHVALLFLAIVLLASALSSQAWEGLRRPVPAHVEGVATLLTDPVLQNGRARSLVRLQGRHFEVICSGEDTQALLERLAGQRVFVRGGTSRVTSTSARRRHVAARIAATEVRLVDSGGLFTRSVNEIHEVLHDGARSLPREDRALLMGFVVGDDREQSDEVEEDFQNAGLSHLLAVSGQNVAFVLLLVAPLLRRFPLRGRVFGGLMVLIVFGALTRWQPSVVRAEAMAAVVLVGVFLGRKASTARTLGLATTFVLLCDPFLIGSVGFLLSLSACIGIALFASYFEQVLPGPLWLRTALGCSLGAELGVAPVLAIMFDDIPIVGILANLLVGPVAGAVMIWGLVAGLVAGVLGEPLATLLHLPTRSMTTWVRLVARHSADLPVGSWTPTSLCAVALGFWCVGGFVRRRRSLGSPDAEDGSSDAESGWPGVERRSSR